MGGYFTFSIIEYAQKQEGLFELSNSLYSARAMAVNINDEISLDEVKELAGEGVRVFVECNSSYRFFAQSDEWKPAMREGNFFSPDQTGNRAVVGKEMTDLVKQRGQKQYIEFLDKEYEVIGIMGASYSTSSDYLVLLQPDSASGVTFTEFLIDGGTEKRVRQGAAQLRENLFHAVVTERSAMGIARISDTLFFSSLLRLCAALLLIIGFTAFFRLWYEKRQPELRVLVILGISGVEIVFAQMKRVICHMAAALLISDGLIAAIGGALPEVRIVVLLNGGFLMAGILLALYHIRKELQFG